MGSGNSYKKLFSTTMILAIGSFSSKVLVFLLVPFYTRVLSQSEYGTANLITQAYNLSDITAAEAIKIFFLHGSFRLYVQPFSAGNQ